MDDAGAVELAVMQVELKVTCAAIDDEIDEYRDEVNELRETLHERESELDELRRRYETAAALAAVEFLATHACVKFENLVLIAPFGGLFPDGVPNHAHHQCHQSLFAKLGLGQHGVVGYHEADLVRLQRRGVGDTPGGSTDRGGGVAFFHDSSADPYTHLTLPTNYTV